MKKTPDILRECAQLFEERAPIYKDSHIRLSKALAAFFPGGITLETPRDFERFALFLMLVFKMTRYTCNWETGHQDSIRDNTVYSAMLETADTQLSNRN